MEIGKSLKRRLGLLDVFCIASGAMISSGLFILPSLAYVKTGPALFVSYIIASCLVIPALLSKAELVTAMPRSGGDYFFISRSMGLGIGAIGGLASWFSLSLKSAFALIGMGVYLALIARVPVTLIALVLCLVFVIINLVGIKEASMFQRVLVIGLFVALGVYIFCGFPKISMDNFIPFAPYGTGSIFATAGFVFVSYGGLTKIASVAEEVKHPGRNIPVGMILSIIIVSIIYALVVFVTTGILSPKALSSSLTPISDGAGNCMGTFGAIVMAVAAVLAFVSTANAGIMSASRYPIAMGRDKVLPSFLKEINTKFGTPHYSIIVTGLFMACAILFLNIERLVKVASTFFIILYLLANLAVIIMRESKVQNYKPKFKSPLYPWMQILGITASIFLLLEMGRETYFIVATIVAVAFVWYLIYVRPKVKQEFALVHLIERITAKELTSNYLEKELLEILKERDNIVEDRFDRLVNECDIVDIDKTVEINGFFHIISERLSKSLNMPADSIFKLLVTRENESSTVIRPGSSAPHVVAGLAIPHIVVRGEGRFSMLLARCKKGITFPKTGVTVHIVFVLAGTKDERNFHLRALAAIAEIAQAKDFDKSWLNAKDKTGLRNIILTAERRRFTGK
ncbi:MAG: amino acid permease [Candidatus Omnitrophica bacterium]|nr:amino acid permease [Candidatus Omnitrophota bacterium]